MSRGFGVFASFWPDSSFTVLGAQNARPTAGSKLTLFLERGKLDVRGKIFKANLRRFVFVRIAILAALVFLGISLLGDYNKFDLLAALLYTYTVVLFLFVFWFIIKKVLFYLLLEGIEKYRKESSDVLLLILVEIGSFHASIIASTLFFMLPGKSPGSSFGAYGPYGVPYILDGQFTFEGLKLAQSSVLDAYLVSTAISLLSIAAILIIWKDGKVDR